MNDASQTARRASRLSRILRSNSRRGLVAVLLSAITVVGAIFLHVGGTFRSDPFLPTGIGHANQFAAPVVVLAALRPVTRLLSLVGTVEPGAVVNVTAPFDGPVQERHADFGARVERGQVLLVLDTGEIELKIRDAEVAVIKATQKVEELKNWQDGSDVARAQNAVLTTQLKFDELVRKEKESRELLDRGIIPRNEHEDIAGQLKTQKLQLGAAHQDLNAVLKKGDTEHRRVAVLELENATRRLEELNRRNDAGTVKAPVPGLVLRPAESANGKEGEKADIQVGSRLTRGQTLLAIADTENLKVRARVDEIDVNRVHEGQAVQVTGDAFGGATLAGTVARISAQADSGNTGMSRSAAFEVIVAISSVPANLRERVRIGMSAKLLIVTYENPAALVVPVWAVHKDPDGAFVMRHDPSTGDNIRVPVTVGKNLEDGIEILSGIKPGDSLLVGGTDAIQPGLQQPAFNGMEQGPMELQSMPRTLTLGEGSFGEE